MGLLAVEVSEAPTTTPRSLIQPPALLWPWRSAPRSFILPSCQRKARHSLGVKQRNGLGSVAALSDSPATWPRRFTPAAPEVEPPGRWPRPRILPLVQRKARANSSLAVVDVPATWFCGLTLKAWLLEPPRVPRSITL